MLEIITQTKICSKCKTEKAVDMFSKCKRDKDGLQPQCKQCVKRYYAINKESILKQKIEYNKVNKKAKCEYSALYRDKNKCLIANKNRIYRVKNKDILYEKSKKYFQTDNGEVSRKNSKHRRRKATNNGDVTTKQLLELQQNAKVCYWCNEPLKNKKIHIDHYVPLSKGGEHTLSNLVVSCSKCNQTKNSKDPIKFANSIGKLL